LYEGWGSVENEGKDLKIIVTILLIFFSFSSSANDLRNEWLKQDKAAHLVASIAITSASIELARDFNIRKNEAEVIGFGFTLGIGIAKEFLHDSRPSPHDITCNIIVAFAGVYINRWLQRVKLWK
jgi:uncharacterized protein YfiM (DUF2279 family)